MSYQSSVFISVDADEAFALITRPVRTPASWSG